MKSSVILKTLTLCAVLASAASPAMADGRACPLDSAAPAARAPAPAFDIEAALREGRVTPYQAGQMLRRQWEVEQMRRGFAEAGPLPGRAGNAASARGCDLAANLAPLGELAVAGMANGARVATTVMHALLREADRLTREQAADEYF
jgi:hypothetical protein